MEITHDGAKVYVATGSKDFNPALPSITFLHGAGMDHSVWTLFARHFARHGCNSLAFDLAGHGRSGGTCKATIGEWAQWVDGVLGTLGVEKTAIVGHSMGSLVALETAARYPARITKAVLVGFGYPMAVGQPLLDAAQANHHDAVDMMIIWGHDYYAQFGASGVPAMSTINVWKRVLERAGPGVIYADLNACHTYTGGEEAAGLIQCPVTIVSGDRDRMTPVKGAKDFLRHLPKAKLEILAECGHGLMEERPEGLHKALVTALG